MRSTEDYKLMMAFYFASAFLGTLLAIWVSFAISMVAEKIRKWRGPVMTVWVQSCSEFREQRALRTPGGAIMCRSFRYRGECFYCQPNGKTHCGKTWIPGKGF